MQQDTTIERARLNHFLLLGTINHLVFIFIVILAYASSGFKTSGDSLGGSMMLYALTFFMPQFVFGMFVLVTVASSLLENKGIEGNRKIFNFYTTTLVVVLVIFFIC